VELQDALATYILEFVPRTFKSQIRMIVISFRIDANIIANPEAVIISSHRAYKKKKY